MTFQASPIQLALVKAAKVGHLKLMQELISLGADPYQTDDQGKNAVTYYLETHPQEVVPWQPVRQIED